MKMPLQVVSRSFLQPAIVEGVVGRVGQGDQILGIVINAGLELL